MVYLLWQNWATVDYVICAHSLGSLEHLEQIPTVMVTFVKATFVHTGISQLLLTWYWYNFKGSFQVTMTFVKATWYLSISGISLLFLTQFWPKFISNISAVNCPYFDHTFWAQFFRGLNFLHQTFYWGQNYFFTPNIFEHFFTQNFFTQIFLPKIFGIQNFVDTVFVLDTKLFGHKFFWTQYLRKRKILGLNLFKRQIFCTSTIFLAQNFFWPNFF